MGGWLTDCLSEWVSEWRAGWVRLFVCCNTCASLGSKQNPRGLFTDLIIIIIPLQPVRQRVKPEWAQLLLLLCHTWTTRRYARLSHFEMEATKGCIQYICSFSGLCQSVPYNYVMWVSTRTGDDDDAPDYGELIYLSQRGRIRGWKRWWFRSGSHLQFLSKHNMLCHSRPGADE